MALAYYIFVPCRDSRAGACRAGEGAPLSLLPRAGARTAAAAPATHDDPWHLEASTAMESDGPRNRRQDPRFEWRRLRRQTRRNGGGTRGYGSVAAKATKRAAEDARIILAAGRDDAFDDRRGKWIWWTTRDRKRAFMTDGRKLQKSKDTNFKRLPQV